MTLHPNSQTSHNPHLHAVVAPQSMQTQRNPRRWPDPRASSPRQSSPCPTQIGTRYREMQLHPPRGGPSVDSIKRHLSPAPMSLLFHPFDALTRFATVPLHLRAQVQKCDMRVHTQGPNKLLGSLPH